MRLFLLHRLNSFRLARERAGLLRPLGIVLCSFLLQVASSCREPTSGTPRIDTLEPRQVSVGRTQQALIRGEHFDARLSVPLDSQLAPQMNRQFEVWLNNYRLPPDAVVIVDSGSLQIQLPATLPLGWHELKVRTPGNRWAALPLALEVVSATEVPSGTGGSANLPSNDSSTDDPGSGGTAGSSNMDTSEPDTTPPVFFKNTLTIDGKNLVDRCGEPLLIRGVEQALGTGQLPPDTSWPDLVDEIADSGVNALRIYPKSSLSNGDLTAVLSRSVERNLVVYLTPQSAEWLGQSEIRTLLAPFASHLVLDALNVTYNNRSRFVTEAKAAIEQIRGYGYEIPLFIMSNTYGRDLPALLQYGEEIIATDPQANTLLGWTAYWGNTNWYQNLYGLTIREGMVASAQVDFPIQLGLIDQTDWAPETDDFMDYAAAISSAQAQALGWTWGPWYNPVTPRSTLSADGTSENLRSIGQEVVNTLPASIAATSRLACSQP